MQFKPPGNTDKYFWTQHAIYKLRQYGLSAQRVIRVINNPQRKEEGIVPKTVAVMQPASTRVDRSSTRGGPSSTKNKNGKKVWSQEIWAMYKLRGSEAISNFQIPTLPTGRQVSKQNQNSKFKNYEPKTINQKQIKIISAWRYPGISPKRDPIPEEILREISELSEQ